MEKLQRNELVTFQAMFLPDPKDHFKGGFYSFEVFNIVDFTVRLVDNRFVYSKMVGSDVPMEICQIEKMYKIKFYRPRNKSRR